MAYNSINMSSIYDSMRQQSSSLLQKFQEKLGLSQSGGAYKKETGKASNGKTQADKTGGASGSIKTSDVKSVSDAGISRSSKKALSALRNMYKGADVQVVKDSSVKGGNTLLARSGTAENGKKTVFVSQSLLNAMSASPNYLADGINIVGDMLSRSRNGGQYDLRGKLDAQKGFIVDSYAKTGASGVNLLV